MLSQKLKDFNIILASGSPRRQQFFKDLDLTFEIRLKDIEEIYPEDLQGVEITNFLAQLKANAFADELTENEILVTSDTIVWLNNKALGKPKDYDDAFQICAMLFLLFGKETTQKTETIFEVTKVTFNPLTDESIRYYLDHYKPFDKAGAYGIQEWIGLVGISKIEGSYTNVVGLPTEKVYHYLNNFANGN